MTSKTGKGFKLLTTAIVTAINASDASPAGTVWKAEEINDVLEGDALVRVGIAEESSEKATVETAAAQRAAKLAEEDEEGVQLSGVRFDAVRQDDGTFRNAAGHLVNQDGTAYDPNRDVLDTGKATKAAAKTTTAAAAK